MTSTQTEYREYGSVAAVITAAGNLGSHFFSPDTLRFFSSRVHGALYGGRFFVTGEKRGFDDCRREYRVRVLAVTRGPNGEPHASIETVSERYASRSAAHTAARKLAERVAAGESVADIVAEMDGA